MQLRSLGPHEVALHRDIRLRALQEAPDAFGEAFEDAAARPSSYWEDLTRPVTERGRHAMFLACEAQDVLGLTYALRDRDHGNVGRVGGFRETGIRRPFSTNPARQIVEMEASV